MKNKTMRHMDITFEHFPPGPLDVYRKRSSFDWRELKFVIEGEENAKYKAYIWKSLEEDPIFHRSETEEHKWQELHHITFKRIKRIRELNIILSNPQFGNFTLFLAELLALFMYDPQLSIKHYLSSTFPMLAMETLGTKEHINSFKNSSRNMEISACFAMTEVSHGSYTKGIRTEARFDKKSQEFVLHTPDFEACKVWAGNLGQLATHAIVYAQLYTPDGKCHGIHGFIVPVRDPQSLLPFPGITVGDLGPKIGMNGLDNGFIMFNQYRISKECFLNKLADVSLEGQYISQKSQLERFQDSLGQLSVGRLVCQFLNTAILKLGLIVAIRYSAVRRQFRSTDDEEIPLIEYQLQQWRLFPYMAAIFVFEHFALDSLMEFASYQLMSPEHPDKINKKNFVHALSCCGKAMTGWVARDAIQECREACGAFGYLKASNLGNLRDIIDANLTYEGDNNVIMQQTSNYLLSLMKKIKSGTKVPECVEEISFLNEIENIKRTKCSIQLENIQYTDIVEIFQWLVCFLLGCSYNKHQAELQKNHNAFYARCNSQVFYSRTLAEAFFQLIAIKKFTNLIAEQRNPAISLVLDKLGRLYGLRSLHQNLSSLYKGGYFSSEVQTRAIEENILNLFSELKDEMVSLADAIAPPDFILNSVLGNSDGQLYKHLEKAITNHPGATERPYWWKEVVQPSTCSQEQIKSHL